MFRAERGAAITVIKTDRRPMRRMAPSCGEIEAHSRRPA